jgi:DNA-binding beta-propeller fold protein YncE
MSGITRQLMRSSGGFDPAWDLDYAYFDPSPGANWSLPGAKFLRTFSVAAQDINPTGLFFKPDGTKMYVSGDTGNDINEYDLSTAWDLTTAAFLQSFIVGSQDVTPTDVFFKPDGTRMYVLGDTNNAIYEYVLDTPWDVSTAVFYVNNISVGVQEATPTDVTFKPDGTKMYVCGISGRDVNEYDLSAAWVVTTATFVQSFSVSAQETAPTGVTFKPDGLKMYICGTSGDDVNEYDLSTAWDVSTAVFSQNFSVAAQDINPEGVFFRGDGLKMYVVGSTGDSVNEYDLSTAWDVSTAVFLQNFSVAAQETDPTDVFFKPDGTKMYVLGDTGNDVNEYDLSTAWDISTAVFLQSVTGSETVPEGMFFRDDGVYMYVVGSAGDRVYQYVLGTPWDVSTAGLYSGSFSFGPQETAPSGMAFKPDGTKMYVCGLSGIDVNEYDLSAAWVPASATFVQSFSVNAQETLPTGVTFKPDGTRMYVCGTTGDGVDEYTLSTPWDVSTATFSVFLSLAAQETLPQAIFFKPDGSRLYMLGSTGDDVNEYDLQGFSVAAQDTSATDVFFKPDGLKMYVLGDAGNDVNEYDLSVAWDLGTAVFLQNFSVGSQEGVPLSFFFRDNGLKMYICGTSGDDVNEYDLNPAWDVSTAVFLQNFSVAAQDINPAGLFFKPDGTKMYMCGISSDSVHEYDLSTAWDVSTAVFLQSFSVTTEEGNPEGVFFKPDGTKMFVTGTSDRDVYEYALSTAWDVSTATFSKLFDLGAYANFPEGLFFRNDGTKMFIIDSGTDKIFEFSLAIQP